MGQSGRLAVWLWRRFRHHYAFVSWIVSVIGLNVGIVVPIVVFLGLWFDLGLAQALELLSVISAVVAVGLLPALFGNPDVRIVGAWGRRSEVDSERAWLAALRTTTTATIRGVAVVTTLHLVVTVPYIVHTVGLGPYGAATLVLALLLVMACAAIAGSSGFQFLLHPVLEETAALSDPRALVPEATWGLGSRLQVGILSGCWVAGAGSAGITSLVDTVEARWVAAVLASLVLALYVTALYTWGLVRPTLGPLAQLTDATRRVRRGGYDEALPITNNDELGELTLAFNQMQHGLAEREALHAAFGSYVDPVLAQRLLESGSPLFAGEDLVVTVLFADVRDFTAFSERVEPAEAVAILNRLFDVIVPVLLERGGHANHYLGDGLLAIFGAPSPMERHADAAVASALEIQRRVRADLGGTLRLGIGINTGPVIAGTVGGGGRHEFTVIGDTVNVAARVEELTKETGDAILITESTRAALTRPRPRSTRRGAFDLKGKSTAVELHAVSLPRTQ